MPSLLNDQRLEKFLEHLHAQNDRQIPETKNYLTRRAQIGTLDMGKFDFDDDMRSFFSDKMVALDRNKAELCYVLCRSLRAARIVEAGTSFGVSTLYLAAALRDNQMENGVVIGTEHEPQKAKIAHTNFREAGLEQFIDLRKGDLQATLKEITGPIDFMLIDIWEVALPAIKLVSPHLRQGAVVACDNTAIRPAYYREYFEFVHNPINRFITLTLPYEGGFELSVRI